MMLGASDTAKETDSPSGPHDPAQGFDEPVTFNEPMTQERDISPETTPRGRKMTIGLALGGGAARGWAHIGVLRTLAAAGYDFDIIAGTSIGAVVGGCFAAGKLDDLEDFVLSLTRRRVFGLMDFNIGGSGLISGNKLSSLLEQNLGDTLIEDLPGKFIAVATEMRTGHEIWLQKGHMVSALRASYALPGVFKPTNFMGRWLFDGAMVNPVPVSVCRGLGARLVIAVNLQTDMFGKGSIVPVMEDSGDESEADASNLPRTASRLVRKQLVGASEGAPGMSAVMMDALSIMQDRISRARMAGDPPDVTVGPRLHDVGLFDFHRAKEAIDLGAEATERMLGEISAAVESLRERY
ncbi:MAG: patatin-like phospholipase family protein [Rhodobiaceae bacterium]|nr:patatin-like phospholipase family protein [Rhodobiaceae bacterium]MCC0048880.1 patatin-like phospholipase family protein [Rhodobiaceae bacterium]